MSNEDKQFRKKDNMVTLWMSDDEKADLVQVAADLGMSMSAALRFGIRALKQADR